MSELPFQTTNSILVDVTCPMQMTIDFSCDAYIKKVNAMLKSRCGMTSHELIDLIFADCHRHGLAPVEAVEMFLADNEHLLADNE